MTSISDQTNVEMFRSGSPFSLRPDPSSEGNNEHKVMFTEYNIKTLRVQMETAVVGMKSASRRYLEQGLSRYF